MINVLFIGVGEPAPPFIEKLIRGLDELECCCYVVISGKPIFSLKNGKWIKLITADCSIKELMTVFIKILFNFNHFIRLYKTAPVRAVSNRLKWSIKMLPIVLLCEKIDLIHLQWVAMGISHNWLRSFFHCPIIGSARGSQVSVYPKTKKGYLEKITKSIHFFDYIHCVSQDIKTHCMRLGAEYSKLFVVYNGVDIKKFSTSSPQKSVPTIFSIIFVGALMWRKGIVFQLLILKKLLQSGREVKLILVGEGGDRNAIYYYAYRLGLLSHIVFKGRLASDKIQKVLEEGSLYISTSFAEGLSNSVVEAMAMRLPVVAFDCEGMKECIQSGSTGFIVPVGDIEAAVEKIALLYDNRSLLIEMGRNARKLVESKFNSEFCRKELLSNYIKIIKNEE